MSQGLLQGPQTALSLWQPDSRPGFGVYHMEFFTQGSSSFAFQAHSPHGAAGTASGAAAPIFLGSNCGGSSAFQMVSPGDLVPPEAPRAVWPDPWDTAFQRCPCGLGCKGPSQGAMWLQAQVFPRQTHQETLILLTPVSPSPRACASQQLSARQRIERLCSQRWISLAHLNSVKSPNSISTLSLGNTQFTHP